MADVVFDSNVRSQRSATSARRAPSPEPSYLRSLASRPAEQAQQIPSVGVVGTGERSAIIAERLIDAGFPVTLHGSSSELLDEGLTRLDARLNTRVRKGELTRAERDRRTRLVCPTCWYIAMSSVDIVIVCDDESEDTLPAVLEALDRVMKRGAILATPVASSEQMKLIEIIKRGAHTSDDVAATLLTLANALDRTPA
jgi:3-hydroxyacyl-CoA dehydrogenase